MGTEHTDELRPLEVLVVEDSVTDVRLLREVLRAGRILVNLHVVEDGVEALAFLRRSGAFADAPAIDLLLLDLKLPRKGGREVLAELRALPSDDRLARLPIVIITTSESDRELVNEFGLPEAAYITKPFGEAELLRGLRAASSVWVAPVVRAAGGQP